MREEETKKKWRKAGAAVAALAGISQYPVSPPGGSSTTRNLAAAVQEGRGPTTGPAALRDE